MGYVLGENLEFTKATGLQITDWQRQIVLGSLLGTGFLMCGHGSKHFHFGFRNPKRMEDWVAWKTLELKGLARNKGVQQDRYSWIWTSYCDPYWDSLHELCYHQGRKRVHGDWLNPLRDIGLAVWFCDKGGVTEKRAWLKVNFDRLSKQALRTYCNEVGFPCELSDTRLVFSEAGTDRFLATVGHRIPEFFHERFRLV